MHESVIDRDTMRKVARHIDDGRPGAQVSERLALRLQRLMSRALAVERAAMAQRLVKVVATLPDAIGMAVLKVLTHSVITKATGYLGHGYMPPAIGKAKLKGGARPPLVR